MTECGYDHAPVECCCAHGAHLFAEPDKVVGHPDGYKHPWSDIPGCEPCLTLGVDQIDLEAHFRVCWQLKVY